MSGRDNERTSTSHTSNELSGTVGGSAVQVGHVAGDVTVYGGTPASVVPHEVPAPRTTFVDRECPLDRSKELLTDVGESAARILYTGMQGVGKTAVTRRLVGQLRGSYPGGELLVEFWRLRDEETSRVSEGLAKCLRALGVDESVMPRTLGERASMFQTRTSDKPVLVVLDDVLEPAEVEPFVPRAPGSAVLITSSRRLPELVLDRARVVPVDPLAEGAGIELLINLCGRDRYDAESAAARELVGLCGGFPLALEVATSELCLLSGLSIADIVAEISAADDESGVPGIPDAMLAVLSAAYRRLSPEAGQLYRKLGMVPGTDFTMDLLVAIESRGAARRALAELVDSHLVEDAGAGRYRMHDLMRLYARALAEREETDAARREVRRAVVDYYLRNAAAADLAVMGGQRLRITERVGLTIARADASFADKAKALAWMEPERTNLIASLRAAADDGWNRRAWQLAEAMTALYVNRRYLHDWIEATRIGVLAAEQDGAWNAVIRLRSFVSRAHADLGELDRAREEVHAVLPAARNCDDRRLEASVWELIGRYHDALGAAHGDRSEYAEAIAAYRRARTLFAGEQDGRGEALVWFFLGRSQHGHGESQQALETLRHAHELIQQVPDQRMARRALVSIGSVHAELGDYSSAVEALHQAIAGFVDGSDTYYEAQAREELADVAASMHDHETRRQNLHRAWEVHESFGSPRAEELRAALAEMR